MTWKSRYDVDGYGDRRSNGYGDQTKTEQNGPNCSEKIAKTRKKSQKKVKNRKSGEQDMIEHTK